MSSDPEPIVEQIAAARDEFEQLIEMVTGPTAFECTAGQVERSLWRKLLALGARLLRLFFSVRASERPEPPVVEGIQLRSHGLSPTSYFSVFGKIRFRRHYFYRAGAGGRCPLDAELALPAHCYSELLRDWLTYTAATEAYEETVATFAHILGHEVPKLALERAVREDAIDVSDFYEQKAVPVPAEEGSILVISADGKGVAMITDEGDERPTRKQEAVVTAHYTVDSYLRSAEQVIASLMGDEQPGPRPVRPEPVGKELRATLAGKDAAFQQLEMRMAARDGPHIIDHVALTDGAEALQERMLRLSGFTLVLDIIHVLDYLWAAADALYGDMRDPCRDYVRIQFEELLNGHTQTVVDDLSSFADVISLSDARREPVDAAVRYFTRNAPYMRYSEYLARGWPIATGVVEGACGHLVKDRMERAGMRWTPPGAQPVLDLRAARINDDWDAYRAFHHELDYRRRYAHIDDLEHPPEHQLLDLAA